MINNIRFKTIAGKINKIPEFYATFARKMPDYIIRQRDRGHAEAKCLRPRRRPKLRGRGRIFEAEILASRPLWPPGLNITVTDSTKIVDLIDLSYKSFGKKRSATMH